MFISRAILTCCTVALVTWVRPCGAAEEPSPEPPVEAVELRVIGTVLLPDGRPATGAIVRSFDRFDHSRRTTNTDRFGKFDLEDPCLGGLWLHAMSSDGSGQAVVSVPEVAVRSALSRPLTVTLQPAKPYQVVVTAEGRRVEGARWYPRNRSKLPFTASGPATEFSPLDRSRTESRTFPLGMYSR